MSNQTQSKHMKRLAELLSQDLGYIHGERESGPNGAKKEFLNKGRAFLAQLGKDLGFQEAEVRKNIMGIASSGEVTLRGMWSNGGLHISLEQMDYTGTAILYRPISDLKDYSGGRNGFIDCRWLARGDYQTLVTRLLQFKEGARYGNAA